MGIVQRITDGLANLASGLGTAADKRAGAFYQLAPLTSRQIDAAYRGSWLVRKIVDIPALDMTRGKRAWQAGQGAIAKLEAEETRLQLWAKLAQALILGRLGGGAIILGVGGANPQSPLDPEAIRPGTLAYLHVVSRWRLALGPMVSDPASPLFGRPEYFELAGTGGAVRIHPSRVVVFPGAAVPDLGVAQGDARFWGDSVLQSIDEAVKNADTATGSFASLIHEAKVDTIAIPGLIDLVATPEGEAQLRARVEIANLFKSIWNARIIDGGNGEAGSAESWETRQISWAGIPEIMNAFMGFVAGAADIPATRLLGRSPEGMNATGQSDLAHYYAMIAAKQGSELRPQLEQIDAVLKASAGVAGDAWFTFPPLHTPSEQESAATFKAVMEAIETAQATGLVPEAALAKGAQNLLVERGYLPGLEDALGDADPRPGESDPSRSGETSASPSTG